MISLPYLRQSFQFSPKEEARALALIDAAVDLWESATRGLWKARTGHSETVQLGASTCGSLFLRLSPVTAIANVEERGSWGDHGVPSIDGDWEALTADDYVLLSPRELKRARSASWSPYVRVSYSGGYANDTAPDDVLRAIAVQVAFDAKRNDDFRLVTSSQNFEGGAGVFLDSRAHPLFTAAARRHVRKA